jgi:putative phosphoesterase
MQTLHLMLIADTHGRIHPAIEQLAREVDMIVHAGDIGSAEILDRLTLRDHGPIAVRGNNDTPGRWPIESRDRLATLPDHARLELPGGVLVVEHGHRVNPAARRHELLRQRYPDSRLVVYGHSHRQCVDNSAMPWIANPGAAGRSRTFGGSSCLLLTASPSEWTLEAYRFPLGEWKT